MATRLPMRSPLGFIVVDCMQTPRQTEEASVVIHGIRERDGVLRPPGCFLKSEKSAEAEIKAK